MRSGRVLVVVGVGLATALGTAAPATAAPRSEAGTARSASTVRAGSPAAAPAAAPVAPAAQHRLRHRPRHPHYPPLTGRLYLSASRVRVGSTVGAIGTGFQPRTSVLVVVRTGGSRSGGSDTAAALAATGVSAQRSAAARRCSTNRGCIVRANRAGLAIFTVRLTRVGRTTITAMGLTPQGTVQTLSASVQVLPRRRGRGRDADDGSTAGHAPAPARAPATPMTAAGLLLTSVAGLALRRRQQLRGR